MVDLCPLCAQEEAPLLLLAGSLRATLQPLLPCQPGGIGPPLPILLSHDFPSKPRLPTFLFSSALPLSSLAESVPAHWMGHPWGQGSHPGQGDPGGSGTSC